MHQELVGQGLDGDGAGVRVMELACSTRPTSVLWLGLKRTMVGLIGSLGLRMILLTSQADFVISLNSQIQ
ncbi:hypothetical protein Y695_01345 [Hydrogenophaga sp. T4]|nr:hypothetical protein Y695_01345 [Hydrogenophaga sp. T4]